MAETLEPGWYWVKPEDDSEWVPAERTPNLWWFIGVNTSDRRVARVGPRLTPPEKE